MLTAHCRESSLLARQLQALERENAHLKERLSAAADVIATGERDVAKYKSIVSQQFRQLNMRSDRF